MRREDCRLHPQHIDQNFKTIYRNLTLHNEMARQWILNSQDGFEKSLEYQTNVSVPSPGEIGPNQVLVSLHAASLNYRELVIAGPVVYMANSIFLPPLTIFIGNQWAHHTPGCARL